MKIVSLKRDLPEMECPRPSDYSWGLCLRLGHEEIEKLGIDKMPEIGASIEIAGTALVVALRDAGEDDRSIELQVTDLGLGKAKSAAARMYPSAEDDD